MDIAVIGAGAIGARHVTNAIIQGHRVIVVDDDPAVLIRESRTHGDMVLGFLGLDTFKASGMTVLAAVIATPAKAHLEALTWALDTRTPVYCEKPVADIRADTALLISIGAQFTAQCVPNVVGYNWPWRDDVARLRLRLQGRSEWCRLHVFTDMSQWPGPGARHGEMITECSHELALIHTLTVDATVRSHRWVTDSMVAIEGSHDRGGWEVVIADGQSSARGYEIVTTDGDVECGEWRGDASCARDSEHRSLDAFLCDVKARRLDRSRDLMHGAALLQIAQGCYPKELRRAS